MNGVKCMGEMVRQDEVKLGDWNFRVLQIKDKEMYSQYIRETEYPANLFSSNFDLLWASSPTWGMVLWKIVDGMLVTFKLIRKKKLQLAFLPLGRGDPSKVADVVYKCLNFCYEWNGKKKKRTKVRAINDLQLAFLRESPFFEQRFRSVKLKGVDRHVGIQNLLTLKGKQFQNVRQSMNKFRRNYPDTVIRRVKPDDFDVLLKLKEEWNCTLGKKYPVIWDDTVYKNIIQNHHELDHLILVVEVDGKIAGVITGGILPHGQAWAGLLKRKEQFSGLSDYLIIELTKEINRLNPQVELINLGIDVGPRGGLRAFKDKFRPVLNCERYLLRLK